MKSPLARFSQVDSDPVLAVNDYDDVAPAYSKAMGHDYSAIFLEGIGPTLAPLRWHDRGVRYVDLACGSGDIACALAKRFGIRGLGFDRSERQVASAKARAAAEGLSIAFKVGDVLEAELPHSVDLITMTLDAINHLPNAESWRRLFDRVFQSLRPSGIFIFDMNTEERLLEDWRYPEVVVKESITYLQCGLHFERSENRALARILMQIFAASNGAWTRYQALVEQIAFPIPSVFQMLRETGFTEVRTLTEFDSLRQGHIFMKNREFIVASRT